MKIKKIIYYIVSIIIFLLLSFIIHATVEMWYLKWAQANNHSITWSTIGGKGGCALSIYIQIGLPVLSIIGGLFFAKWGWNKVYSKKINN